MTYPTYDNYRQLYGRYLKKGPELFFTKQHPSNKSVLDLCSGGGQLTRYALEHGAKYVTVVDLATQMANAEWEHDHRYNIIRFEMSVEHYLSQYLRKFDIVTCRQGINYWFKNVTGEQIASVVEPGGLLVFNTFGNKPTEEPMSRVYYHGGKKYQEVSFLFEGKVHHMQCCEGMEPHVTVFDWIDHNEYSEKLNPYFITEEEVNGPSSMWHCWRK